MKEFKQPIKFSAMSNELRDCLSDGNEEEVLEYLKQININKPYSQLGCVN